MKIKNKPYNLLLLTGIILVLFSFFSFNKNSTTDIQLHDFYLVVAHAHIFWLLAFLAFFIWLLYFMTSSFLLSKILTWIHVLITILMLLALTWILSFGYNFTNISAPNFDDYYNTTSFDTYAKYSIITATIVIALLFGQIIYLVNIVGGLLRRRTKQ